MSLDDSKKKILARRASFIAAAMATVACQKAPADKPEPCLSIAVDHKPPDAEPPLPCLSPRVTTPDDLIGDAGAEPPAPKQKSDAGTKPTPLPHPCLTPKRP